MEGELALVLDTSVLHRLLLYQFIQSELPQRARLWTFHRQDWTPAEVEHSTRLQSSSTIKKQFKTPYSFVQDRVQEMVQDRVQEIREMKGMMTLTAPEYRSSAKAQTRMNPIARLLLLGHSDGNSSLSVLPQEVLSLVFRYVQSWWRQCVTVGGHISKVGIYASVISELRFPAPTGINVNMMPIMLGALATVLRASRSLKGAVSHLSH